jgi:hemolysin activation/secretion protein
MSKLSALVVVFLAMAHCAFAQSIPVQPAPAQLRSQIQQIPPAPTVSKKVPDIRVERGLLPVIPEPGGPKFAVSSLHIAGATRFPSEKLIEVSGFQPGAELDLAGLRTLAARITAFYNQSGYFVAQAYVPAQTIENGTLTISVVEGRYGEIILKNSSKVSSRLARRLLAGLHPGAVISVAPLERRLLLLSDLPGVIVRSRLEPGLTVGTSDLVVELTAGRRVTGSLEVDNAGNPYTGSWRGGGTVNFNEPTGHGDIVSARLLGGGGLDYGQVGYQAHVAGPTTVGVTYSAMQYQFGLQFRPLDAWGRAQIVSLYAGYPIIRTRANNLEARLSIDARAYDDKIRAFDTVNHQTAGVVTVGAVGDFHDAALKGAWTTYWVNVEFGHLNINSEAAKAVDAATARAAGSYQKAFFDVARLQRIRGPVALYGEVRGQLASKNLTSFEKMELGGAYGVRAYPEGEAYGDQGYIVTGEARYRLPPLNRVPGALEAAVFVDHGAVQYAKDPWYPGPNDRNLTGAGASLTWIGPHAIVAKVTYAHRVGPEPALSVPGYGGSQVWLQLSKVFG